ncbi:MAG: hypothetical protein ABL933_06595 [Methyloglobulus sp.]|nr:hypothetical protein [Methyloglobulus sp.]
MIYKSLGFAVCFIVMAPVSQAEPVKTTIGHFSTGSLTGWKDKEFKGQTQYQISNLDDTHKH